MRGGRWEEEGEKGNGKTDGSMAVRNESFSILK